MGISSGNSPSMFLSFWDHVNFCDTFSYLKHKATPGCLSLFALHLISSWDQGTSSDTNINGRFFLSSTFGEALLWERGSRCRCKVGSYKTALNKLYTHTQLWKFIDGNKHGKLGSAWCNPKSDKEKKGIWLSKVTLDVIGIIINFLLGAYTGSISELWKYVFSWPTDYK